MLEFTESQLSNALVYRFILPHLEQLGLYQLNTFNPVGPVYFYHPLTETDTAAFDDFALDEDAYEFIEEAINIIGHEEILYWFGEDRKKRREIKK